MTNKTEEKTTQTHSINEVNKRLNEILNDVEQFSEIAKTKCDKLVDRTEFELLEVKQKFKKETVEKFQFNKKIKNKIKKFKRKMKKSK